MKFKNIFFGIILILALLPLSCVFAGLGISPAQMSSQNLLKGSHFEKTFVLSRSDPVEDLEVKATTEGTIKDWITVDKGMDFALPAGQNRFPIVIKVDVPQDVQDGDYNGGLRLVSYSKTEEKGENSSSTSLSVFVKIKLTVSDKQVSQFTVSAIKIEGKQTSDVKVILKIMNSGNTNARPSKLKADFYDKYNINLLESKEVTEISSIEAFKNGDITVLVPTKLKAGQYWAKVTVYNGDIILKNENLFFEITKSNWLASLSLSGADFIKIILILTVIIAIGVVYLIFLKNKKRRNKHGKSLDE